MTGDVTYSAAKAGYNSQAGGSMAKAEPAVQAEIVRVQTEMLFSQILPEATAQHLALLRNPATPAGAKVQAIKLAYDRTLGAEGAANAKQPHEMTPEELAKALADAQLRAAALESAKADRARPVIDHEPEPEADIFG